MLNSITTGLIGTALPLLQDALTALLFGLFSFVIWSARRYLGVRASRVLQLSLDEAIDRAIAQNGSEPSAVQSNLAYILGTMGGTVKGLGASETGLRSRIEAQQAQHRMLHQLDANE